MKNVTVSLDERILAEARVEAARAGKSLSKYMADLVTADVTGSRQANTSETLKTTQLEAIERILSGPKWSIMREGRMPTADERNER